MKTTFYLTKGLSFLLMACISLCASSCMKEMSESVSDEKVGLNGGFEQVKQNMPVNWLLYTQKTCGKGDFSITAENQNAAEGQRCLHMSVKSCSDEGGRFSPGISSEIKAEAGRSYRLSCKVRNSDCRFRIRLSGVSAFESAPGPELQSAESIQYWRELQLEYTMPEEMDRLRIEVNVLSPGEFWIDDIKLN